MHKSKPSENNADAGDDKEAVAEAEAAAAVVEQRGSRLTDQLISQGLLTKSMMSQLKREWRKEGSGGSSSSAAAGKKKKK